MVATSCSAGFMEALNAFPPTIWWRCGDGRAPGLTRLEWALTLDPIGLSIRVIITADLRVETVHNELRAKESKHDGVGGRRDRHAGSKNRSQTHIVTAFLGGLLFILFLVATNLGMKISCLWYDRCEERFSQIQAEGWMDDTTAHFILLELRTTRIF